MVAVRKDSVQVRPEAPFHGDHDVTAASRPVTAFVPVRIRLVTPISKCFESASSRSGSLRELFCALAGSIAVRFRTLAENQLQGRGAGETPHTVRGRETGAQAQPESGLVRTRERFSRCRTVVSCLGLKTRISRIEKVFGGNRRDSRLRHLRPSAVNGF